MRILVLGGTAWLGREIATTALARGHEVTCLARGRSGSPPDGVVTVLADRDRPDAYEAVAGNAWDAVVDVSRQPGQVRRAVAALQERAAFFVFVSTLNVYADTATPGQDESAPLLPALEADVMESEETYGEAKVACEEAVLEGFGAERCMLARVGLIGGPGDTSGRSGYWPWRFARPAAADGAVLVPDPSGLHAQLIDVRDLATWLVEVAEQRTAGKYNVTGDTTTLADFLALAREVAGHSGPVVEADRTWLKEQGVQPWMGKRSLPLWLPIPEYAGFATRRNRAARAAGLRFRPLSETLADTLAWELSDEGPGPDREAGLSDDDERALLEAYREAGKNGRP